MGLGGAASVSKVSKHLSKASLLGFAGGMAWEAIGSMNEGKGVGESLFRGAAVGALQEVVGAPALIAWQLASAAPALAGAAMRWNDQMAAQHRSRRDPSNMNFSYTDTQQALTMRQAAVQAIQGSKMNARSALGGEARLMHRGVPTKWD